MVYVSLENTGSVLVFNLSVFQAYTEVDSVSREGTIKGKLAKSLEIKNNIGPQKLVSLYLKKINKITQFTHLFVTVDKNYTSKN